MTWAEKAHQSGIFLTVALGFAIPVSTSLTDILGVLVLVMWFFAGHYKTVKNLVRSNPVVQASLLLFLILIVGMIYTPVSFGEAGKVLKKYRELLLLVFLIPFLAKEEHRDWAQKAFALAMLLTLVFSFYKFFSYPDNLDPALRTGNAFKDSIIHSFLLAVFAFGLMTHILHKRIDRSRIIAAIGVFIVATVNLFFMTDGRTGFVIYYLLGFLLVIQQFKWRMAVLGMVALGILHFGAAGVSDTYNQQMGRIVDKVQVYLKSGSTQSSIGKRMEFIENSYYLIAERPVFGHGTGSFKRQYAALAEAKGIELKTVNPHNEYLMIGVQTGLVGVGFLLYFIFCQWKYSFRLTPLNKNLAMGLALVTAAGCMANSFFLDHTEGMFIIYFSAVFFAPLTRLDNKENA